jgi:hypothetical protein
MYLLDVSTESAEIQENGIVFVFDFKGLSFDHARSVGLHNTKKLARFIQVRVMHPSQNPELDLPMLNMYKYKYAI